MPHRLAIPRALLVLLAATAARAAAADAGDLVGAWRIDAAATWANLEHAGALAQLSPDAAARMKDELTAHLAEARVEFTAATMAATVDGTTRQGTYRVTGADGQVLHLDLDDPENKAVQHGEARLADGQLFLKIGDQELVLVRAATPAAKP